MSVPCTLQSLQSNCVFTEIQFAIIYSLHLFTHCETKCIVSAPCQYTGSGSDSEPLHIQSVGTANSTCPSVQNYPAPGSVEFSTLIMDLVHILFFCFSSHSLCISANKFKRVWLARRSLHEETFST